MVAGDTANVLRKSNEGKNDNDWSFRPDHDFMGFSSPTRNLVLFSTQM